MCFNLKRKGLITQKEIKYFTYEFEKSANLGKFYLLPKIHKRLSAVPGRPVISNCGTPTEKTSEFVDFHLKPIMQNGWSYVRDSNDFINKIKNLKHIPSNSILVTAEVVGLYPCNPHESGLNAIKEALENRERNVLKMLEFVSKNNYFEFTGNVKQQLSGTAIGTKYARPYAYIFMVQVETGFLQSQKLRPMVWFRYNDDIFCIWTHGEQELQRFLHELNKTHPNLKFTHESSKEKISFLDLSVSLCNGNLYTDIHIKATGCHQYLECISSYPKH